MRQEAFEEAAELVARLMVREGGLTPSAIEAVHQRLVRRADRARKFAVRMRGRLPNELRLNALERLIALDRPRKSVGRPGVPRLLPDELLQRIMRELLGTPGHKSKKSVYEWIVSALSRRDLASQNLTSQKAVGRIRRQFEAIEARSKTTPKLQ